MAKANSGKTTQKAKPAPKGPNRPLNKITIEEAVHLLKEAGIPEGQGPTPELVQAGIAAYVHQFEFWYTKQWDTIISNYFARLIKRANPFVRRAQHGDATPMDLATALVADWDSRNFVTAGGQALEALAISIGKNCQKAIAEGVDIQRVIPTDSTKMFLYTVKSGAITRNTDIVSKMKTNLRKAERLAKQNPNITQVELNYATCVGTPSTTVADGIRRPSSACFWSEIMELSEDSAIKLLWAVTETASGMIALPDENRKVLIKRVATYLESSDFPSRTDWAYLIKAVTLPSTQIKAEHMRRDKLAKIYQVSST